MPPFCCWSYPTWHIAMPSSGGIHSIRLKVGCFNPPRERPKQQRGSFFECRGGMMRAHAGPIDHRCVHIMRFGDGLHDPVPVARIAPSVEAIVDRCGRAVFTGQVSPKDAGAQDVENAVDDAAVIYPL